MSVPHAKKLVPRGPSSREEAFTALIRAPLIEEDADAFTGVLPCARSRLCLGVKEGRSGLPLELGSSGWGQDAAQEGSTRKRVGVRGEMLQQAWLRHQGRLPGGSGDWTDF